MPISRKSFIKWTLIVLFCGAHSFFWGITTKANIPAMIAGMLTLIIAFSWVESHPRYQARRLAKPIFARALDIGVKIRLLLAGVVLISLLLMMGFGGNGVGQAAGILSVITLPYMAEMFIGMAAIHACELLTGWYITAPIRDAEISAIYLEKFAATYLTTMLTILIHTAILSVICGVVYLILKVRRHASKT